jgi:hypothetical protein
MLYLLSKRFHYNEKLQEYLKVLKKKKFDETYPEEEPVQEEEEDDDSYKGKFRF